MPSTTLPLFRFVPPVYTFTPVSVCVPVPASVRLPAPPIVPPKVPLAVPPSVSALPPRLTLVPAPPDSAPSDWAPVAALRSSVAPAPARFTAPVDPKLPPAPSASVPSLIVVVPAYVFAPVSVVVAGPFLTRPPPPEIGPLSPRALLPPSVSAAPVPRLTALVSVRFAFVSSVAAPPTFTAPKPSAWLLPSTSVPLFRFVPPE